MKKLRGLRLNGFDIIIIIVVLAVAAAGYAFLNRGKGAASESINLRYVVELTDLPEGFCDKVSIGDKITDNVKNYYMGDVVSVEKTEYRDLIENYEEMKYSDSIVPERETALITIEAKTVLNGANFTTEGNFIVKAGKEVKVKGKGYAGEGYIITVERKEGIN